MIQAPPRFHSKVQPVVHGDVASWQALSQLYEQADELQPAELAGHLEALAQRGEPLLPALRQMLAARDRACEQDFLCTLPALNAWPDEPPLRASTPPSMGQRVGPYRLLHWLGQGGMAEVWLAERADGAFKRQVAIKLLHAQAAGSRADTFAQRFARERDILAALHHPHIAGLHDAGIAADGQAWLALEYVPGQPITQWCDSQQLGLDARVQLFCQVLDAVAHAHANLVLHRDLKPGNILVNDDGQARLLDFGIAKLIQPDAPASDDTEMTRRSGRPLTPQYASPEQLLGQPLTTASDVFSLGVVLYELLCGLRPQEPRGESTLALEQAVVEQEPRPPSRRVDEAAAAQRATTAAALRRRLAGDLDAIAAQALAKRPEARYATVAELRADVQRWLAGEPVLARRPTAWYRAQRFVARHKLGSALGAGAVLALVGVATVAVVLGLQARAESRRAQAARSFVLDLFQRADPDRSHGANITAREMLAAGAQALSTTMQDQPELRVELLGEVAKVQQQMGLYTEAARLLSQRIEMTRGGGKSAHAHALLDAAENAQRTGDVGRAAILHSEALVAAPAPGTDAVLLFRQLYVGGVIRVAEGRGTEAQRSLQAAVDLAQSQFEATDIRLIDALSNLADAMRLTGEPARAVALLRQATEIANRASGLPAADRLTLRYELALALFRQGQYGAAHATLQALVPETEAVLGVAAEQTALARKQLVVVAVRLGRASEVANHIPLLKASLDAVDSVQLRAGGLSVICRWAMAAGRMADWPSIDSDLAALADGAAGESLSTAARRELTLIRAEARLQAGQAKDAAAMLRSLLPQAQAANDAMTTARASLLLGLHLTASDQAEAAVPWLTLSSSQYKRVAGPGHASAALARLHLADALRRSGQIALAKSAIDQAWPVLDKAYAGSPAWQRLARLRDAAQGRPVVPSQNPPAPLFLT